MTTKQTSLAKQRRMQKLRRLLSEVAAERGTERGAAAQLAMEAGTPASYLSAMASGTRGVGDELAERLAEVRGKPEGWFDSPDDETQPGELMVAEPTASYGRAPAPAQRRTDILQIPLMSTSASMGPGALQSEHEDVIQTMSINRPWLNRQASFSSAHNLALITGFGDSMKGTFEDGDVLIVDRGITDIKVDAVYVLELNDELYVKRLQRRPDGSVLMISDNKSYEPYLITNGDRERFRVLGRVVLAWNARRL
jgi:phage repressor protein C with HTH and peptisase S24 domain